MINEDLYKSNLYEYLENLERKISNKSEHYPPALNRQERIVMLLCRLLEDFHAVKPWSDE